MANYEIMLIVSGSLDEKSAKKVADDISSSIKDCKPKVHEYGSKQLAYKIKKDTTGYYYQYNFECDSPSQIFEFGRLSTINKSVLRTLIINLEKDYGYRASINPKKVARSKKTAEIHAKIKAEIEKNKAAREAERMLASSNDELDTSKKMSKAKKTISKTVEQKESNLETTESTKTKKASSKTTSKKVGTEVKEKTTKAKSKAKSSKE